LLLFQRFDRQAAEDGPDPSSTWGKDREESDPEDLDSEDYMPIPKAGTGPTPGKSSVQDWTDDDASDIEVHDPTPLAFKFPLQPSSAAEDEEIHEVAPLARGGGKKRTASSPSDAQKRRKVGGSKSRERPMAVG
jgi:hypothetical protein